MDIYLVHTFLETDLNFQTVKKDLICTFLYKLFLELASNFHGVIFLKIDDM